MRLKLANDFSGSQYLHAEGSFHVTVLEVDEAPTKGQQPVDGFKVTFGVQAGTVDGVKGKTTSQLFESPHPAMHSEGLQRLLLARQSRFLLAVGLIQPGMEGQEVEIDLQNAVQRQCVVDLVLDNKEKRYLQINGQGIYHVDDPECAGVPKNEACLAVIAPGLRRKAASVEKAKAASSVKAAANKAAEARTATAAEIDDL